MALTDKNGGITGRDILLAHVRVGRDETVWRVVGGNVTGLIVHADTLDELIDKIELATPSLLKANVPDKKYDGLLIDLVTEF